MNKNLYIKIAVIVACFGGSGLVLYFGLFNKGPAPTAVMPSLPGFEQMTVTGSPAGGEISALQNILPNGGTLDFSKAINPSRFKYHVVQYPKLNPATEVGIPPNEIILPPPAP
jgi:hypothetical protein